jgi:hypothetical protein
VAVAFHEDTPLVLARAGEALRTRTDPEAVRRACRSAARRMVQAGFAVVMARAEAALARVAADVAGSS